MRGILKCAWFAAVIAVGQVVWAVEVTPEQARVAAANWVSKSPKRLTAKFGTANIDKVLTSTNDKGLALYHVVNLADGGFVVAAGDTQLPPVIAFSDAGELNLAEKGNPLRTLLERDMAGRIAALSAKQASSKATGPGAAGSVKNGFEKEWDALLRPGDQNKMSYGAIDSLSDVRVAPMVQSKWGQSTWNGYATFNYYTPNKYVSGCVATAFAQIMRYWQKPTSSVTAGSYRCWVDGTGSTYTMKGGTYSWSNMPLTSSTCTSDSQRQAIGKLLYDVGVASQMEWSGDGSGTLGCYASQALRSRFGYASSQSYFDITGYGLTQDFTTQQTGFRNAILASLDAEMPVAIGVGGDYGGHEMVVDGYGYSASTIYCHINCGWSGSEDAWYNLLGGYITSSEFGYMDEVGYNIHPTTSGDVISGRVLDASGNAVSGATVTLTPPSGGTRTATTNAKGIYSFRVTTSGSYRVSAAKGTQTSDGRLVALTMSVACTATKTSGGGIADASGNSVFNASGSYIGPSNLGGTLGNSWGNDLTLSAAVPLPGTPSLQTISTYGSNANTSYIELKWSAAANATSYNVYRNTSDSTSGRTKVATNVTSPYKNYVSSGLTPGVRYWYWVEAVNSAGSTFSGSDWGNILVSLSTSPETVSMAAGGGTATLSVTANTSWSAAKSDSWLSLSTSGTSGNGILSVIAAANTTGVARSGYVVTTAGAGAYFPKTVTNTVTQAANSSASTPAFSPSSRTASIPAAGGTGTFTVTWPTSSGVNYQVSSPNESWLTISQRQATSSGNYVITITYEASANTTGSLRTATIPVTVFGSAYTFTVTQPASSSVPKPNWGTQIVAKDNSAIVYAKVYDVSLGSYVEAAGSLLAVFKDNECRGCTEIMAGPNGKLFQLSVGVSGASEAGFALKVWNAASGETSEIGERISCTSDGTIGTIGSPREFRAGASEIQVSLASGWTWFSTCLEADDMTVASIFSRVSFANGDVVKSATSSATYQDGAWYPSSFRIEPGKGYCIKKSTSGTSSFTLSGTPMDDGLPVKAGWNWIGSTTPDDSSITDIEHSAGFADNDVVKDAASAATYHGGQWYPDTFTVKAGKGYKINLAKAGTLSFACADCSISWLNAMKATVKSSGGQKEGVPAGWQPVAKEGSAIAYLRVAKPGGGYFEADGSVLAAFSPSGECRGRTEILSGPTCKLYQLSVSLENATESGIKLKVWDASGDTVYDITDTLTCTKDGNVGSITSPQSVSAAAGGSVPAFGVGEVAQFTVSGTQRASIAGMSNVQWGDFSGTDAFGTKVLVNAGIVDAEKTAGTAMKNDDTWCYPLSDMNALFWTGWGQAAFDATVDDLANYFRSYPTLLRTWNNGDVEEGEYGYDGLFDWFEDETGVCLWDYTTLGRIDRTFGKTIRPLLDDGSHVIRLAVYFRTTNNPKWSWCNASGGVTHGVLCVGYVADTSKDSSDPSSLKALFIVDPDNSQSTNGGGASAPNTVAYCPVTWNNSTGEWSVQGIWGETSVLYNVGDWNDDDGYRALAKYGADPAPAGGNIADAVDCPSLSFDQYGGGTYNGWFAQSTYSTQGGSSMQSGTVGEYSWSSFYTPIEGPAYVDFLWALVSDYSDGIGLATYLDEDNEVNLLVSGSSQWEYGSAEIPAGTHLFEWCFFNNVSDAAGASSFGLVDWISVAYGITVDTAGGNGNVNLSDGNNSVVTSDAMAYCYAGGSLTLPSGAGLSRDGYEFDGWNFDGAVRRVGESVTMPPHPVKLTAQWTKVQEAQKEFYLTYGARTTLNAKGSYFGHIFDGDGWIAGTVEVKAAALKNSSSRLQATVSLQGGVPAKLKGATTGWTGNLRNGYWATAILSGSGKTLELYLNHENAWGYVRGNGGSYFFDCARNFAMDLKGGAAYKSKINAAKRNYVLSMLSLPVSGTTAAGNGYIGTSIQVGLKGKTKLVGVLPDLGKVSATVYLEADDLGTYVPVYAPINMKKGSFGAVLLSTGTCLPVNALWGIWNNKGGKKNLQAALYFDEASRVAKPNATRFRWFIPDNALQMIPQTIAGGAVQYSAFPGYYTVYDLAFSANKLTAVNDATSKMKLSYNQKTGLIKGSFYALTTKGKKKVTVNGVFANRWGDCNININKTHSAPALIRLN